MIADMKTSAELTKTVHDKFEDVFMGMGFLKEHFYYKLKREPNHTKYPQDRWHLHYKSYSKAD